MRAKTKWYHFRWHVLALLLCVIIIVIAHAESLIFHPPGASYENGSGIPRIEVGGDELISAIYMPHPDSRYTLLFSHGNAEDIGQNLDFFRSCNENGLSVFAYDYRGYGTSDGDPSVANTYEDIQAAYNYLVRELGTDPNAIIVHGRSVGSGPSCYLASRKPVAGLILESAFTSIHRVVIGISLPFDPYNNLKRIKSVRCPLLVIHGKQDSIIPFEHGQLLYNAGSEPKANYWVEGASHNDLLSVAGEGYWQALNDFEQMAAKWEQLRSNL